VDARGKVVLQPFAARQTSQVSNLIVDDLAKGSYTGANGLTLQYRLFTPAAAQGRKEKKKTYPLVQFLHGGGETGSDNFVQVAANQGATAWANPSWQAAHPAFVLAPQVPSGHDWADPDVQTTLFELEQKIIAANPIDQDRIYLTGLSRGGTGSYGLLSAHPKMYAGALIESSRMPNNDLTLVPKFKDVPLWANQATDDGTVPYTIGSLAIMDTLKSTGEVTTRGQWRGDLPVAQLETNSRSLLAKSNAAGGHDLLTTFDPGSIPGGVEHFSWVPTLQNQVELTWLFDQKRR
jgi:predicted peptidase